jgi:hypothetical protein
MNKDLKSILEAYNSVTEVRNTSNDISVDTLIDAIKQQQVDKGNSTYAYSYVVGVLGAILKSALPTSKNLQEEINRTYKHYTEEV